MWANAIIECRKDLLGSGLGYRQYDNPTLEAQGS